MTSWPRPPHAASSSRWPCTTAGRWAAGARTRAPHDHPRASLTRRARPNQHFLQFCSLLSGDSNGASSCAVLCGAVRVLRARACRGSLPRARRRYQRKFNLTRVDCQHHAADNDPARFYAEGRADFKRRIQHVLAFKSRHTGQALGSWEAALFSVEAENEAFGHVSIDPKVRELAMRMQTRPVLVVPGRPSSFLLVSSSP